MGDADSGRVLTGRPITVRADNGGTVGRNGQYRVVCSDGHEPEGMAID